jgi:hypothetical protein
MAKRPVEDQIKAGEYAFALGKSMSANPHAPGTTPWGRWHYGWCRAEKSTPKVDTDILAR